MAEVTETHTWLEGSWHEGNTPIMGVRTHAAWLGSSVFDGARVFDGVMPDIDLHCMRLNDSAVALGLKPIMRWEEMVELSMEGSKKFASDKAVYVKPMYWAEGDGASVVLGDPETTRFCLCMFEAPMPAKGTTITATVSTFKRPTLETMPVNAKAGCLYPNNARVLRQAKEKGFDNALVLDMLGNVAELGTANVFMAKDGVVHTPVHNGTFLNGITRQRLIKLLRESGYTVHERVLTVEDFKEADEIFSSGNYAKTIPVTQLDDRHLQPGPIATKAFELYMDFAHS